MKLTQKVIDDSAVYQSVVAYNDIKVLQMKFPTIAIDTLFGGLSIFLYALISGDSLIFIISVILMLADNSS